MAANKARGTRWETAIVNFGRRQVHSSVPVTRVVQAGQADQGDIHVGSDFVLQAKDWQSWGKQDLWNFVEAAQLQAQHAGRPYGVAVVKRRKGNGSTGAVGTATVAMDLETFYSIVTDLEEGREALERLQALEDED